MLLIGIVVIFIIGVGIVAFIINNSKNKMEPQTRGGNAKDFFINLGAIVALYTLVVSLVNLLFTIINTIYPQITDAYNYYPVSASISWPVATLVIFFPIFILLMWLMEKSYVMEPERKNSGIHRWLTYITLFLAGLAIAGDLIAVLYYFLDGRELTTGFLMKVLVLFVVASAVFTYYISDVRDSLTAKSRMVWRVIATVMVLGSIVWGFSVLGSPATQRLYKYDEQKVNDLMSINNEIMNYYSTEGSLPAALSDIAANYYLPLTDTQTDKQYEYRKTGERTYELCAEFNKSSPGDKPSGDESVVRVARYGNPLWMHPVGRYCFPQTINPNIYSKPMPIR